MTRRETGHSGFMLGPLGYYYRGYVEPHLLRQRNPTEAELKVKDSHG